MKLLNLTLASLLLAAPAMAQGLDGEFEAIDTNGDGYITAEELDAAQKGTLTKQNEETMSVLDKDGDGFASMQEYTAFYSQLSEQKDGKELERNFKTLDSNHDGKLDIDELKSFRESTMDDTNKNFMDMLDSDHDGKVSRKEYDDFAKSMEEMFKNVNF